jgi:hypothetical protein
VKVSNESTGGLDGAFSDLIRFQAEFQARLAEETLRYLRKLHGALGPAAPGTVVAPDPGSRIDARAAPGATVREPIEIENRQRVHVMVTPALTPLISSAGATWFPAAEISPPSLLLAPEETGVITIAIDVPASLAAGEYRGALILQGFREGGLPLTLAVGEPAPAGKPSRARTKPRARKSAPARASRRR